MILTEEDFPLGVGNMRGLTIGDCFLLRRAQLPPRGVSGAPPYRRRTRSVAQPMTIMPAALQNLQERWMPAHERRLALHRDCDACRAAFPAEHPVAPMEERWAIHINSARYVVCEPCFRLLAQAEFSTDLIR